jgi:hypothetical protein
MTDLDDSMRDFLDELDVVPSTDSQEPETTAENGPTGALGVEVESQSTSKSTVDNITPAAEVQDNNGEQGSTNVYHTPAAPKQTSNVKKESSTKPASSKSSENGYKVSSGPGLYERSLLQREENAVKLR